MSERTRFLDSLHAQFWVPVQEAQQQPAFGVLSLWSLQFLTSLVALIAFVSVISFSRFTNLLDSLAMCIEKEIFRFVSTTVHEPMTISHVMKWKRDSVCIFISCVNSAMLSVLSVSLIARQDMWCAESASSFLFWESLSMSAMLPNYNFIAAFRAGLEAGSSTNVWFFSTERYLKHTWLRKLILIGTRQ